jgi:hypothetical protein
VTPWWLGLAPAQATVACGGQEHRLRWRAGELSAIDHEDAEAERALVALGGVRCACVDALDAWARHRDDVRVLVLASRGQVDPLAAGDPGARFGAAQATIAAGPSMGGGGAVRRAPRRPPASGRGIGQVHVMRTAGRALPAGRAGTPGGSTSGKADAEAQAEDELIALLGLGGGLSERLVATVTAALCERLREREPTVARLRPQLQAALHGRACATIWPWLGDSDRELQVKMTGEDGEPSLRVEANVLRAELPFGWLLDVWCRGLASVWGRLCLAASTEDGRTWSLVTVGPDLGAPETITLTLQDGGEHAGATR